MSPSHATGELDDSGARSTGDFEDSGNDLVTLSGRASVVGRDGEAMAGIVGTREAMRGTNGAVDERATVDLLGHPLTSVGEGDAGAARQVADRSACNDPNTPAVRVEECRRRTDQHFRGH